MPTLITNIKGAHILPNVIKAHILRNDFKAHIPKANNGEAIHTMPFNIKAHIECKYFSDNRLSVFKKGNLSGPKN